MSQTWQFKGWVDQPKCISIRAKDFLADYPGVYQGDHLVLNLLIKFDTLQVSDSLLILVVSESGLVIHIRLTVARDRGEAGGPTR
jgi:hypothetical protein